MCHSPWQYNHDYRITITISINMIFAMIMTATTMMMMMVINVMIMIMIMMMIMIKFHKDCSSWLCEKPILQINRIYSLFDAMSNLHHLTTFTLRKQLGFIRHNPVPTYHPVYWHTILCLRIRLVSKYSVRGTVYMVCNNINDRTWIWRFDILLLLQIGFSW